TRTALLTSAMARAALAVLGVWLLDGLFLFPVAFGLLVMSRVHGIARAALLPAALDRPTERGAANARRATVGVVGSGAAGASGGRLVGPPRGGRGPLALAVAAFAVSAMSGRLLPRLERAADRPSGGPRTSTVPRNVRLAQVATATVRLLNGFLVLLLAFA